MSAYSHLKTHNIYVPPGTANIYQGFVTKIIPPKSGLSLVKSNKEILEKTSYKDVSILLIIVIIIYTGIQNKCGANIARAPSMR